MNYTDKELLRSAQIAYYDINEMVMNDIKEWVDIVKDETGNLDFKASFTLSELFNHSDTFKTSIYRSIAASLGDENFKIENYLDSSKVLGKIKDRAKYVAIEEVYNIINELEKGEAGSIGSWKLVSFVFNDDVGKPGVAGKPKADGSWDYGDEPFSSSGDGLCVYVFETCDDSAIVAFRGSQPLNGLDDVMSWDFVSDWIVSDGGLALENEDTVQQQSVYKYIDEYVSNLGYDHYSFAGHSLGGNLALHAALSMYKADNANLSSINQAVSFDGPGYNEEYINRHSKEINALLGNSGTQMTHYAWSIVGVLLEQYATDDWTIKAGYEDTNDKFHYMTSFGDTVTGHNPAFVQFDDTNSSLIRAEATPIMVEIDMLVGFITSIPSVSRPAIIHFAFELIKAHDSVVEYLSADDIIDSCEVMLSLNPNISIVSTILASITSPYDVVGAIGDAIESGIIDNAYDLLEMTANNKHTISDTAGVNQLLFPCTKDELTVSLYGENDLMLKWREDNDYIILEGYRDSDNDAHYNLIFSDGVVMSETNGRSPFRTLHGTADDDIMRPLFDDGKETTSYGGYGSDTVYGGTGDDIIHCDMVNDGGNGGSDIAHGGDGADTIYGESGNDELRGGNDGDYLYGQNGDDLLCGESGNDVLNGGNGKDILHGGEDNDLLHGGESDDTLIGGEKDDMLIGGGGTNTFRFLSIDSGHDTIDGSTGDTVIELPYTLNEEGIRAVLDKNNNLVIVYGNSTITITDFFVEYNNFIHSDNTQIHKFRYRFGDGTEKEMKAGSFACKLYDGTFMRPIADMFGDNEDTGPSNPYNRDYNEMADRIFDIITGGDADDFVVDDSVADRVYDDYAALKALDDFMNDPNNNAYINDAFDPDDVPIIRGNIKRQLDYITVVRDELPGLITAYNAFVNYNDSSAVSDMADSASSMKDAYDQYVAAQDVPPLDPLIIDIAGDGFAFSSADEGVNFDMNNDGFAEKTGWTNGNDALLVLDRDGDGSVTNGGELFGDQTTLADGTLAPSGFAALAEFDENADSRIDSADPVFGELRVWQDANHNGISEADELSTLADTGIEAISLISTAVDNTDAESGAYFASIANVVMSDGSDCNIGEFKFQSNLYDTNDLVVAEISEEIAKLPNVRSFGSVLSLHKAMALDVDDSIYEKISAFLKEADVAQADALLEEVLFELCDATDIAPNSRGSYIDARKLAVVERMLGRDFAGVNGSNPNNAAAPMLLDAYNTIFTTYYNTLTSQSTIDIYLRMAQLSVNDESASVNVGAVASYLSRQYTSGVDISRKAVDIGRYFRYLDTSYGTTYFIDFYHSCGNISGDLQSSVAEGLVGVRYGTDNRESISGDDFDDVIVGNGGNDLLSGYAGADLLFGGVGDDTIYGYKDDDYIDGGEGNDRLCGGDGNDTYYFVKGCGNDIIDDTSGYSTIRFIGGITPEDITARASMNDLVVGVKGTTDTILLTTFMWNEKARDIYLEFDNGEKMHCMEKNSPLGMIFGDDYNNSITGTNNPSIIYGLGGRDQIRGTVGDDSLHGGDGDDTIDGGDGNDIVDGGADTDTLRGNAGDDIYIFGRGYGIDTLSDDTGISTIRFIDGISPSDLKVSYCDNSSLKVKIDGTDDALILSGYRYYKERRNIVMEFDDGTVLSGNDNYIIKTIHGNDADNNISATDMNTTIYGYASDDYLSGSNGNDIIYGGADNDDLNGNGGNDILDGGAGSDRLYGGAGDDIYIFGRGYGGDTLSDDNGISTIRFAEGIRPVDLRAFIYDSGSLGIRIADTDDVLVLFGYRNYERYRNIGMEFDDGTVLSGDDNYIIKTIHGNDADNNISATDMNTTIYGYAGRDILSGSGGNDMIYGGADNDDLSGSGGNDIIDGGIGMDDLYGGYGDDVYIFGRGYGIDTLSDDNGISTIRFIDGISPSDLKVSYCDDSSLKVKIDGTDDALILSGYRYYKERRNIVMEFDDGTVLSGDDNYIIKTIHGNDADNNISATDMNTTIYGYAGRDILSGSDGNDMIYGGADNDDLSGSGGNDILDGGTGNDSLNGGYGDDIYIFGTDYGKDTIHDTYGINIVRFSDEISPDDVKFTPTREYECKLIINNTGDELTLYHYKHSELYRNYVFEFADGTVLSGEDNDLVKNVHGTAANDSIAAIYEGSTIYGHDGNDTLHGIASDEILYGGVGDDTLYGYIGNDVLDGGTGNDSLNGGAGNDVYVFGEGYGIDKIDDDQGTSIIQFAEGISADDVKFTFSGYYDCKLKFDGLDDELVLYYYRYPNRYRNYVFEFADGTTLSDEDNYIIRNIHGTAGNDNISAIYNDSTIYGYEGNDTLRGSETVAALYGGDGTDTLYGNKGSDVLDGGAGNDSLNGDVGDDIYIFGRGYGNDKISDSQGGSTIKIVGDVTADDLTLFCTYYNLTIAVNGTEDAVVITDYAKSAIYQDFTLEFEDGSSYSIDPTTYMLVQNETMDYTEAAEVITEMQSFEAAPILADSSSSAIYPNVALINDILSVADSNAYGNVSENKLQFTESTNMLFEQYYIE